MDRFGGVRVREALTAYQSVWQEWKDVEQELSKLVRRCRRVKGHRPACLGSRISTRWRQNAGGRCVNAEAAVLEHAGGLRDAAVSARSLLSGQGEDVDTSSVISMISCAGEHLASMADVDDRLRELGVRLSAAVHRDRRHRCRTRRLPSQPRRGSGASGLGGGEAVSTEGPM